VDSKSNQHTKPSRLPSSEEKQLLSVATTEFRKRHYQTSLEAAQQAAETSPASSEVHQFLSLCYFATGRYEDARDAAHRALHLGQPWTWKHLASHYAASKEYTKQLRDFEQTLRENGKIDAFRFLLGYHYWMLGHLKVAEKEFVKAVEHDPQDKLLPMLLEQLRKTMDSQAAEKGSR